jgi:hypothetical protein
VLGGGDGSGKAGSQGTPGKGGSAVAGGNGRPTGSVETKPKPEPAEKGSKPASAAGSMFEDLADEEVADRPASEASESRSGVAAPAAKPKPARAAASAAAASAKAEPEAKASGAADWSGMHPKRMVRVQMLWVYVAMAVCLLTVVGVWQAGYSLGGAHEKATFEEYLRQSDRSALIQDPIGTEGGSEVVSPVERGTPVVAGGESTERLTPPGVTREVEPEVRPAPMEPEPAPRIDVLVDVREPNHNYMKLASGMTLERARGLAEYLAANGVPAMALDEGRQGFGLYTALAIPSDRFSALSEQRDRHEERVIGLLDRAPREAGGPYNGRGNLWIRFDGPRG